MTAKELAKRLAALAKRNPDARVTIRSSLSVFEQEQDVNSVCLVTEPWGDVKVKLTPWWS